ncbi:MAG TPA: serine/threonine-protein kinase [Candidatus Xenobia bacterium]|jgi:serine/threonine-protein kinase
MTDAILQRYDIDSELGRNRLSTAWLAHLADRPEARVAIKVIRPESQTVEQMQQTLERFRVDAQRCSRLDHPNLARMIEFLVGDDAAYLVAEYVEGQSLEHLLAEGGALPADTALRIMQQLCDGIQYCHAQTPPVIVHAIQPHHIIVTPDQGIKIIDFGQVWADDPGSQAHAFLHDIGGQGFAPIERYVSDKTDQQSDIYALGATVYAMFSGRTPPAAVDLVTGVPIPPLTEAPPEIADLVARMMQVQKTARPQSIAEVRQALALAHAEPAGDELRVRRTTPKPKPQTMPRPETAVSTVALPPPPPVGIPEALKPGIPPVGGALELEHKSFLGKRTVERFDVDLHEVTTDRVHFTTSKLAFAVGARLALVLNVPLLATGQSMEAPVAVVIRSKEELAANQFRYQAAISEMPPKLRPILSGLREQERRRAHRYTAGFRVLSKEFKSYAASACDLSATGFGFKAETSFPVGTQTEFVLDIDDAMVNGLPVKGTVVHCGEGDETGLYRMGVCFDHLDEKVTRPLYHFLHTFRR